MWPTPIELINQGQEMSGGVAVWRQDCQSYACLIEGYGLGWVGDQHGQYPTLAALKHGLSGAGFVVHEPDEERLVLLESRVIRKMGRTWLVGNQTHGRTVLAVVHPDDSVTRLEPEWLWPKPGDGSDEPCLVPFNFGPKTPGPITATAAATEFPGGDYATPQQWDWGWPRGSWGAQDVIDRGLSDLPATFTIDLADVGVWGTDTQPLAIKT